MRISVQQEGGPGEQEDTTVMNKGMKMWWIFPVSCSIKNKMNEQMKRVARIRLDDDRRGICRLEGKRLIEGTSVIQLVIDRAFHSLLWFRINSNPQSWSSAMASLSEFGKISREATALPFKKNVVAFYMYSFPGWNGILVRISVFLGAPIAPCDVLVIACDPWSPCGPPTSLYHS